MVLILKLETFTNKYFQEMFPIFMSEPVNSVTYLHKMVLIWMLESFIHFRSQMSLVNSSDIKIGNIHQQIFKKKRFLFLCWNQLTL